MRTDIRADRLNDRQSYMPRFLRGLLVATAVCGVMAATPSLSQEARGQLSLPDQAHFSLAGGFNGMRVFAEDGTWTAPGRGGQRVGNVLVLLCGAGGGGAGAQQTAQMDRQGSGGGGGGSVLAVVPVVTGGTYAVTIGRGGEPGINLYDEGLPGTATAFAEPPGQVVARADGGGGERLTKPINEWLVLVERDTLLVMGDWFIEVAMDRSMAASSINSA